MEALETLKRWIEDSSDNKEKMERIEAVRGLLASLSPQKHNLVDYVRWVPIEMVEANNYNPNAVAMREMKLLYTSISHDGYTQPIVTIWDAEKNKYVIVDGFHRYSVMRFNKNLRELNNGLLPVVVIDKDINDRMASTIRHNRARGKHSVEGMSNIVLRMLENGWSDAEICNELGLEAEELVRLKYVTGFAKIYEGKEFNKAWETTHQIQLRKKYMEEHPDDDYD